jgi:hypothetical protein
MSNFNRLSDTWTQVRFEELTEVYLTDQAAGEHLEPYFNGMPVLDITNQVIVGYVRQRHKQGADSTTINAELLAIRGMFELAAADVPPRISHVPRIPTPDEVTALCEA